MGEQVEKPLEQKKPEEEKKEEAPAKLEESKDAAPPPPSPPPPEIVLRVSMHCEGCARKVRRRLRGFDGVDDIQTDCKSHKIVVKGEKADPLKVLERVQKRSHRQVELLSPTPKPPAEEPKVEEKEVPKPEEKKEEVCLCFLVTISPALPGFGRSLVVRQLSVTDFPFLLNNVEEDNRVDEVAEHLQPVLYCR